MVTIPQATLVRVKIENAIVEGALLPGTKLDPAELAATHGCSRTPVREALSQLAASGLVTVRPKRGTYVAQLGINELTERFEMMAELEGVCARLAARRISAEELAALEAAHATCRIHAEAGDAEAYYFENSNFHHLIYRATHNMALADEAGRLHAMLQPYRRMQLRVRHRLLQSLSEHDSVVAAIRTGDAPGAETALRNHVMIQGDRFHDLVAVIRGV